MHKCEGWEGIHHRITRPNQMVLSSSRRWWNEIIHIDNESAREHIARRLDNFYFNFHQVACTFTRDGFVDFYRPINRIVSDSTICKSHITASSVFQQLDLIGVDGDFGVHRFVDNCVRLRNFCVSYWVQYVTWRCESETDHMNVKVLRINCSWTDLNAIDFSDEGASQLIDGCAFFGSRCDRSCDAASGEAGNLTD